MNVKESTTAENRFVRAGRARATHGAYALQHRGLDAMTKEELLELLAVEAELATRQGRQRTLRRRVSMGLALLHRIETYIAERVAEGATLDDLKILGKWPAFQNSTLRALRELDDKTAEGKTSDAIDAELREIDERLGLTDGDDETD